MSQQLKHSLILNITPTEIDSVCDDIILFHKGYKFFYAVDSYDFVHFFMPYLESVQLDKDRLNRMAQEKIAYESFFSVADGGNDSIIVLNEYKKELLSLRDLFLSRVKRAVELTNNIDALANELLELFEKGEDPIELINKNYELFFLSLVYTSRREDMKENSFVKFLKKTVHINQFETADDEFNILADQLFNKDEIKGFVETVYDGFIKKAPHLLYKYDNDQLQRYLENTYYDIEAIQRVMSANEKISKDKKYQKTIFYYLSSAPYKSKILANVVAENFTQQFSFLKKFASSNKTIHRNIFQYFLFHKFTKNKDIPLEKALEYLLFIKREIEEKKYFVESFKQENNNKEEAFVYGQIKTRNEMLLSDIENNFYHSLIENYKETLRTIVADTGKKESTQQVIMNPFKEYLSYQYVDLEYSKAKYEHNKSILSVIKNESHLFSTIKIKFPPKNIDIIQFHFHHLPYLPFLFERTLYRIINPCIWQCGR